MTSDDTRGLTSWKEIATHLDVTVRTAQLWEKHRGLPVRRMPGPRSRVYLRIDEYEAWLTGQADEAPSSTNSPRSSTDPYENRVFQNIYHIGALRVADLGDGRRVAVMTSVHFVDEPTQIAVLAAETRELISEYWHSGHIGRKNPTLKLADLNGDGLKEIYAAGVSNARQQATLVVLDPYTMRGASEEPPGLQLVGFETGTELARVFFPRSSMNQFESWPYNFATDVFPSGETIRVGVVEQILDPGEPSIHYELTAEFILKQIDFSDLFRSIHEQLYRDEAAFKPSVKEEMEMLWRQGVDVLRSALIAVD